MEAPPTWKEILRRSRRVAVVGLSARRDRASHGVATYLQEAGFRIVPVNPHLTAPILGEAPARTLSELQEPVDVVDVFRKSEDLPPLVEEILALPWRPSLVWFQLGVRPSPEDRAALDEAGILVVEDRCLLVDHRAMARG